MEQLIEISKTLAEISAKSAKKLYRLKKNSDCILVIKETQQQQGIKCSSK